MGPRQGALLAMACILFLQINYSEETCGRPFFKPVFGSKARVGNRVVNGIEARENSHPWQALIITNMKGYRKRCGGSLIHWKEGNTSDLVLTAAHCVVDTSDFESPKLWEKITYSIRRLLNRHMYNGPLVNVSDVHVYLGVHDTRFLLHLSEHIRVKEIATGEFNKIKNIEDIALLKLDKMVTYSKSIQGICLPTKDEKTVPIDGRCLVAGWGLAANGKPATRLQQVDAYIFEGTVNYSFFYKDRMICARGNMNGSGPRQGDSGSPLACLRNNTFVLYGIMTFNIVEGCSESVNKHAFMNIPYYLKWLRRTIALLDRPWRTTYFNATRRANKTITFGIRRYR